MRTVQQAVTAYMLDDGRASKADSTRNRTKMVLRMLSDEIGRTAPISTIDRHVIDAVLGSVRGIVVEASMNAYRSDLRGFGRWLLACGLLKSDPAAHLKNVRTKTVAAKRKPIDGSQARALIKVADAIHPRDGMTALILLSTGLRDSEVCGLRWRDADFEQGAFLAYRPKLRDWHVAPWSTQLAEAMAEYQDLVEERHGPVQGDWHIVPALAHRGHPALAGGSLRMHPCWPMVPTSPQTGLRRRVKVWLRAVGERDLHGRASHTLRRTAANLLIESGADIRDAQTMLGHASLSMTEAYLSVDAAKAKLAERVRGFRV